MHVFLLKWALCRTSSKCNIGDKVPSECPSPVFNFLQSKPSCTSSCFQISCILGSNSSDCRICPFYICRRGNVRFAVAIYQSIKKLEWSKNRTRVGHRRFESVFRRDYVSSEYCRLSGSLRANHWRSWFLKRARSLNVGHIGSYRHASHVPHLIKPWFPCCDNQ